MSRIFLSVLVFCLGLLNYHWFQTPVETSPIDENQSEVIQQEEESNNSEVNVEIEFASASQVVHTYSRPLFSETRRKWAPKTSPTTQPKPVKTEEKIEENFQANPPDIEILGISMLPGKAIVLVNDKTTNTVNWINSKQKIQGWQIVAISADTVELFLGGKTATFHLYNQNIIERNR